MEVNLLGIARMFLVILIGVLLIIVGTGGFLLSNTLTASIISALSLMVGVSLIFGLVALIVYDAWIK